MKNNSVVGNESGAIGLRPRMGFLSSSGDEMVYIGDNIGKDSKGKKHLIISTTLSQTEEEKRRGVRTRFYNTKVIN